MGVLTPSARDRNLLLAEVRDCTISDKIEGYAVLSSQTNVRDLLDKRESIHL